MCKGHNIIELEAEIMSNLGNIFGRILKIESKAI